MLAARLCSSSDGGGGDRDVMQSVDASAGRRRRSVHMPAKPIVVMT